MKPIRRLAVYAGVAILLASGWAPSARSQRLSANVSDASPEIIASGLNNPRGLKFGPDGYLYVAEGGTGGTTSTVGTTCEQVPAPVGPYSGGPSGRILKITAPGHVKTVVDGLPSGKSSLPSGDTLGVADVAFVGDQLFALLAGGGCSHGNPETPNGIIQVDAQHGTWSYVADLSAFQHANPIANPGPSLDDWEPDGTWYSMLPVGRDIYALEPNHQEIDRISLATGKIVRVADVSASSALWVGPTAITRHGNFFFGNLAPFPIAPGSANVFKLTPSGNFKVWESGFTTVVGLAFDRHDRLYVLELSALAGFPTPGFGKVVRVSPSGRRKDIVTGLIVPTAMTIGPEGALYISNFGAAGPGAGQIIRVDIEDED